MTFRPRILQVITSLAVGGAQHHLLSLIPGITKYADVDLLYFRDHDLRPEFESIVKNITHLPMAGPAGAIHLPELVACIRNQRYSLVHTHLLRADMYGALAARVAGVNAIVSTKHNIEARLASAPARLLHRVTTKPTTRTIAISSAVSRWTVEQLRVDAQTVRVIRYGLEPTPFDTSGRTTARTDLGIDMDTPVLLCPARLDPQKRHDLLLRSFARMRAKVPGALLLCAGETQLGGTTYRAGLQHLSVELGIDNAVRWLGVRSDIPSLMAAADIIVLASDWEGLGLVLMEAAMARRTVVATSVGGVPEIVKHGKTGILVPPDNVEALASALISLFSNHRRRSRMASTAGKYARRVFDLNVMQDATTALYSELLDRRPA